MVEWIATAGLLASTVVGFGVALWFGGDYLYARRTARRYSQWEAEIAWDEAGVRSGCREFTVGSGECALLLVHGINDSPKQFHLLAPRLAEAGFTCRAMRLPGFGMPLREYAQSHAEAWLAAIDAELAQLRARHARVVLLGHSLGGAAAIAYLLRHPDRVEAAILSAPAIEVARTRSPLVSAHSWLAVSRHLLRFTRVVECPFDCDIRDSAVAREYRWRMPFTPQQVCAEALRVVRENRGREAEFRTPLLMLLTRRDQVVDWRAAERFHDRCPAPRKRLAFFDRSGHALTLDYEWPAVAEEIIDFLRPSVGTGAHSARHASNPAAPAPTCDSSTG